MLWAIPLANPITCGGDTKNRSIWRGGRIGSLTIIQQNGDGRITKSDPTESDGPERFLSDVCGQDDEASGIRANGKRYIGI